MKWLLSFLLVFAFALAQEATIRNPVLRLDFADPFVLYDEGVYYAYATNAAGKNVQVSRSEDLRRWDIPQDALPVMPSWARLGGSQVWAPEVMRLGDTYLLYYTARDRESDRQCIGVAVGDRPDGRFRDERETAFVCQAAEGGSIDPHPFRDADGSLYLLWKNDGNCCGMATYLYAQPMSDDGLTLLGEPVRLLRNDVPWEGRVVEAPTLWLHEGEYFLFYSANNYGGPEYAVGYARCESPMGPCEKAEENPILASQMDAPPLVVGPGHQSLIEVDGEVWMAYHVWQVTSAGLRGSSRFLWFDRVVWEDGRPVVQGPTTEPQRAP